MRKFHYSSIEPKEAGLGTKCVKIRWLIDRDLGAENAMRLFDMDAGGETPLHRHPWEHDILLGGERLDRLRAGRGGVGLGDAAFIPPNELHQSWIPALNTDRESRSWVKGLG